MTTTMTVSEARASLPELLNRVLAGDEITITRHGEPVAVMVRPDLLRVRQVDAAQAAADRVQDLLDAGARATLPARGALSESRADELIIEIDRDRSGR